MIEKYKEKIVMTENLILNLVLLLEVNNGLS